MMCLLLGSPQRKQRISSRPRWRVGLTALRPRGCDGPSLARRAQGSSAGERLCRSLAGRVGSRFETRSRLQRLDFTENELRSPAQLVALVRLPVRLPELAGGVTLIEI